MFASLLDGIRLPSGSNVHSKYTCRVKKQYFRQQSNRYSISTSQASQRLPLDGFQEKSERFESAMSSYQGPARWNSVPWTDSKAQR